MSRGHGRVERAILDSLDSGPKTKSDLVKASFVFDTPAARESLRRALRSLRREGLIEDAGYGAYGPLVRLA